MDDRILFDRFHEALEAEPRPGAYERMRFAMADHPIALKRRPVHPMRWSRMGLRMAAALTAAAIAIAVFAVFLATHHAPVGGVPAGQDQNVKAYQALTKTDYDRMSTATSSVSCATILDPTCAAAVTTVANALQSWIDDLNAFQTPARYAVMDGQLRRHLSQAIIDLNAVVAFQKANNQSGFDLAMSASNYERAWFDPATFTIEGSYPKVAGSYHDAVSLARQGLDACANGSPAPGDLGCSQLSSGVSCISAGTQGCENYVQVAGTQVQTFLVSLLQNPPPSALAAKDAKLWADLAQADTDLLAITNALLAGDAAKSNSAQRAYADTIVAADNDTAVILNG